MHIRLGVLSLSLLLFLTSFTWWLRGGGHPWRAAARVWIQQPATLQQPDRYYLDFLFDIFKSATNYLTDPTTGAKYAGDLGIPPDAFRFLGIEQYRSTTVLELHFSGRSSSEVALVAQTAVDHWRSVLQIEGVPVKSEMIGRPVVKTAAHANWDAIRLWAYRQIPPF